MHIFQEVALFPFQVFPLTNRGWFLPVNSWRMAVLSLTTTSRRSPPFTWSSVWEEVPRKGRRRITPHPRRTNTRRRRSSLQFSNTTRYNQCLAMKALYSQWCYFLLLSNSIQFPLSYKLDKIKKVVIFVQCLYNL